MAEWKLFDTEIPHVSTFEFHQDRERAPHLEQSWHQPRLFAAANFVRQLAEITPLATVSDLGCGDGGLLSLVQYDRNVLSAWGYDFAPANAAGWAERGVTASALDVFGADWDQVKLGRIVVMTEVLEHLADPHGVLRRIRQDGALHLVCSSPWNETPQSHCEEHAWAWDMAGYAEMLAGAGWRVTRHDDVGLFQVVMAQSG